MRRTLALVTGLDLASDKDDLLRRVIAGVHGGVGLVQVRAKSLSWVEQVDLASRIVAVVGHGAHVVVNSDPEVAVASGADGVHLPEGGISVADARLVLGPDALIGRSVHSADSAMKAEAEDADYLFFGTVFPSRSHPDGFTSGLAGIAEAAGSVSIPVIGIGGITARNCAGVVDAGAGGVAVISAIIGAYDSYRAAREISQALAGGKSRSNATADPTASTNAQGGST
jgi:thiamine-phosphate diphosphorylase